MPVNNEFLSFFTDEHRQTVNMGSIVTVTESQCNGRGFVCFLVILPLCVYLHGIGRIKIVFIEVFFGVFEVLSCIRRLLRTVSLFKFVILSQSDWNIERLLNSRLQIGFGDRRASTVKHWI